MRVIVASVAGLVMLCGASSLFGCRTKPKPTAVTPAAAKPFGVIARGAPEAEETIGWLTIRVENPPPDSLMAVKPENLPAHVRSLYRLRPDRRFLYAAAELQRLISGGPRRGTMTLQFEKDRWRGTLDETNLGDLPEFPTFADAKGLLVSWLRAHPGHNGSAPAPGPVALAAEGRSALETGLPADVLSSLARLNAGWTASPGDAALAEAGLRGLLWLSLQTFDALELSDPALGKSLALLAIAEAGTPGKLAREECLLASLFGYENHAELLAGSLPAEDPVRLFAVWDLARLKAIAHRPKADPRAEYLYLLRLAGNETDEEAWMRELESSSWGRQIQGPSLRLVLRRDPFRLGASPAALMESQVLEDLLPASRVAGKSAEGGPSWREIATQRLAALQRSGQKPPESRLAEMEEAVDREASRLDGPLLDRHVVRGFYFATFYSSVYAAARYYFDGLSATEAAESFANTLTNPPAGTAAELKDWILHRVRLRRSADGVKAVASDLSHLRHIGVPPLSRISYSVAIFVNDHTDPTRRAPVRGYFERLDTRPSSLHAAARTASELLDDLGIMEQCLRLATERGPRELGQDLPWALRFLGDRSRLRALSGDKTWPTSVRSSALWSQTQLDKIDPEVLAGRYTELIREDPAHDGPLRAAVGILEERGQLEKAQQLVDEWLAAHGEQDLWSAGVTSLKSRLLRKRGRFREAWEIAETVAGTWKEDCLEEAALALLDLGRRDEALQMARRLLDRYGDAGGTALVARILWLEGKDDEAGQLLTSPTSRLASSSWAWALPVAFNEAFKKESDERAAAAFLKLDVPSVPILDLIWFVESLRKNGRAELAVRLSEHLQKRGGPQGWATVATYRALGKARGPASARDWLRANASPADLDVIAKQALVDGDYDLVRDLPDHPDPTKNEILHSIGAAALLHMKAPPEAERKRLIEYF
jgi:tetratricopeptide (TPR) repeat protein